MEVDSNIAGVLITRLQIIPDERGRILHMMRSDDPMFTRFGEIYLSQIFPAAVKGWHEHTVQTQNYCVVLGDIKLVLIDNRPESDSFGVIEEWFLGLTNYLRVTIPPGVVNGYKCISSETAMVVNCSDMPHDPDEMLRYPPHRDIFPYSWDRVDK